MAIATLQSQVLKLIISDIPVTWYLSLMLLLPRLRKGIRSDYIYPPSPQMGGKGGFIIDILYTGYSDLTPGNHLRFRDIRIQSNNETYARVLFQ